MNDRDKREWRESIDRMGRHIGLAILGFVVFLIILGTVLS